jgi:putative Mn2+ efflux pump MntP
LEYFIYILFIFAIGYNVFPLALGLDRDNRNSLITNLLHAIIFGLIQGVMYKLGAWLGSTFMYLFVVRYKLAVFAILLAVSIRMSIEAFKIRKGARLFSFDNYIKLLILAIAAGINTLIVGMAADYLTPFETLMTALLIVAGFVWSIIGISMNLTRQNIILSSMAHLGAAIIILLTGLVYLFSSN